MTDPVHPRRPRRAVLLLAVVVLPLALLAGGAAAEPPDAPPPVLLAQADGDAAEGTEGTTEETAPGDEGAPADAAAAPAGDALYTEAQAERGAELYGRHCRECHGGDLRGLDPFPPLTGTRFFRTWEGRPGAELLGYMRTMMPLGAPGSLEPQTYADVLAWWLSEHGYAAGETELPAEPEALPEFAIEDRE